MQAVECCNQGIVFRRAIAQEHDVDRSRPQGLQAVGKVGATTGNPQAGLAAKSEEFRAKGQEIYQPAAAE